MNQNHYLSIFIIVCLVLFGIFRRVRGNIGWQQLTSRKFVFRSVLFMIIGLIFLVESVSHPISLISDAIGILIGACLAIYGASITQFERRDGHVYYRPNTWIGSVVIAIFFGRLIYRFYEMYTLSKSGGLQAQQHVSGGFQAMSGSSSAPWTAGFMLIMFAYYIVYYMILLRKQHVAQ